MASGELAAVRFTHTAASTNANYPGRTATTGCGRDDDGRPLFCSSDNATRAQVAAFLYRIATTPESWGDDGGILRPEPQP